MASPFPAALINWVEMRFLDADGNPLSGGFLYFYVTGTSTPKDTWTTTDYDPATGTANPNPIELDADGRPPDPIFLEPGAYKIVVEDASNVQQYSLDGFEDIGLTYFSSLGTEMVTGDTAADSGDTIAVTSNFVAVTNAGGDDPATINLPAAADYGFVLTIKNKTAVTLQINPDGSDTMEDGLASYTVPAAVSPLFPSVMLGSDGVSTWFVLASHGIG